MSSKDASRWQLTGLGLRKMAWRAQAPTQPAAEISDGELRIFSPLWHKRTRAPRPQIPVQREQKSTLMRDSTSRRTGTTKFAQDFAQTPAVVSLCCTI